jgi:hypothetical protein
MMFCVVDFFLRGERGPASENLGVVPFPAVFVYLDTRR